MKPVPARAGVVTRNVDAALRPAADVAGRVVDERDGTAIAGVAVSLVGRGGRTLMITHTNAGGRYVLTLLRPSPRGVQLCYGAQLGYRYWHSATGYGGQCYDGVPWAGGTAPDGLTSIPLKAGAITTANARLVPGGELVGTIRDPSGATPPFAAAELFRADGQFVAQAVTNAAGRYVLRNVTPGEEYVLCAYGSGVAAQCFDHQAWNEYKPPPAGSERIVLTSGQVRRIPFVLANA